MGVVIAYGVLMVLLSGWVAVQLAIAPVVEAENPGWGMN